MRALTNTLMTLLFALSNGPSARKAACHRQTCACAFIMPVSAVSSTWWPIHRKGKHV